MILACAALLLPPGPYAEFYPKDALPVVAEVSSRDKQIWRMSMKTRRHKEFGLIELVDKGGELLAYARIEGREDTIDGEAIDAALDRALKTSARRGHTGTDIATIRLIHTHPGATGGYVSFDYDFSPNDSRTAESYRQHLDKTPDLKQATLEMQIIFRADNPRYITKRAFVLKASTRKPAAFRFQAPARAHPGARRSAREVAATRR